MAGATTRDEATIAGIVAGPLYVIVAGIQVVIRPGFDLTRHTLSLLSNGDLGWIQIANFIATGALLVAAGGADVRFNTELVAFDQDKVGVTARIREPASREDEKLRADYLIAADGADGTTRNTVGIGRHGPGPLQHWINVIFESDLETTLGGRQLTGFFASDVNGSFVPRGDGRWSMSVQYVPERGERAEDFTEERCCELIVRGAGRSNIKAEIVDVRSWEAAAYVADRYIAGRVLLVGDAAHVIPRRERLAATPASTERTILRGNWMPWCAA